MKKTKKAVKKAAAPKKATKKVALKKAAGKKAAVKKAVFKKVTALSKAAPGLVTVGSYAGTSAEYLESPHFTGFRMRGEGQFYRLHVHSTLVRVRPTYMAVDIPKQVLQSLVGSIE